MIFVTVGNDFRGFERLLKKMDELAPSIPSEMLIQRGYSRYVPKNAKHVDFIPMDEAVEYLRGSELVVSHAGIGTIILCKKYGTPLLILPRRKTFAEHMNDHQLEIARALEKRKDKDISVLYQEDHLQDAILKILRGERNPTPPTDAGRTTLIETIRHFIKATS